ncbi:hypothetical protein QFC21_001304 [Naganishia friedmannii]|uniref:Uncharacterized protein n=1 Tax=Naganishia friedmannii TaxID=89922 RepID=A0ACC2W441_9TREE|nr:hypothetical protein QFC21_001304 [Naganishia friedmannii]
MESPTHATADPFQPIDSASPSDRRQETSAERLSFLDLAPEILEDIFIIIGITDTPTLAACAATCQLFREILYKNPDKILWREIYQALYDDPLERLHATLEEPVTFDWQHRVTDLARVHQLCKDAYTAPSELKPADIEIISRALLTLFEETPSGAKSRNVEQLQRALSSSTFWEVYQLYTQSQSRLSSVRTAASDQGTSRIPEETLARIAQLNILHGWNTPSAERRMVDRAKIRHGGGLDSAAVQSIRNEYRRIMGHHRKTVYNAGNFDDWNDWGPYADDGTVNWPMLDSVASIMQLNVNEARDHSLAELPGVLGWIANDSWRTAKPPSEQGVSACVGKKLTGLTEAELHDWAGVRGVWRGTYAFMDYQDWVRYNFQPMTVNIEHYSEAVGNFMSMHLHPGRDPKAPADQEEIVSPLPSSNLLPALHFHGVNHYATHHQTTSQVRGSVCLTTDNPPQIRWTWVVSMNGDDRWRLTGIQIGGRGTKRGIVGIWSAVQREQLSPHGPFAFWPSDTRAAAPVRPEDAIRMFQEEMAEEVRQYAFAHRLPLDDDDDRDDDDDDFDGDSD